MYVITSVALVRPLNQGLRTLRFRMYHNRQLTTRNGRIKIHFEGTF